MGDRAQLSQQSSTALMLVTAIIALRFVTPTQLVARVRTDDE